MSHSQIVWMIIKISSSVCKAFSCFWGCIKHSSQWLDDHTCHSYCRTSQYSCSTISFSMLIGLCKKANNAITKSCNQCLQTIINSLEKMCGLSLHKFSPRWNVLLIKGKQTNLISYTPCYFVHTVKCSCNCVLHQRGSPLQHT